MKFKVGDRVILSNDVILLDPNLRGRLATIVEVSEPGAAYPDSSLFYTLRVDDFRHPVSAGYKTISLAVLETLADIE